MDDLDEKIKKREGINFSNEENINATYQEDFDIFYVHNIVRSRLKHEKTRINHYEKELASLKNKIMTKQNYAQRKKSLSEIKELQDIIEYISSERRLKNYLEVAEPILKKYSSCKKEEEILTFGKVYVPPTISFEDFATRLSAIDEMIALCKKYINVEVNRLIQSNSECCGCGSDMEDVATNDVGLKTCPNCGVQCDAVIVNKLAKDGSRIMSGTSGDDESIENFLRAFMRYQGLQIDQPHQALYQELDEYFIQRGLPIGEEIRSKPLDEFGRRGGTNHKMLWNVLSNIKRAEYYDDTNLIGHIYWGWELPKIMHLKDKIIEHYNLTQKVFHNIPLENRKRSSSLGTQFRLWKHLQLLNHKCFMAEFKIAEDPDSLNTHYELWKLMCEGANNAEIYYIG